MGTIVSPVTGSTFYRGSVVPVVYRSDTVDFNCGSLSKICSISYKLDAVTVVSSVAISQTGLAPQTQAAQNITLPLVGVSTVLSIDARGVGGQQNDTASATYNLVALPTAACSTATSVAQTTATLNGTIAGTLIAGGSARFVWGSPTPNTNTATSHVAGAVNANLTGLTPNTTYNYRLEVLDSLGNIVATSAQCSLTTLAVVVPPAPTAVCSTATSIAQTTATLNGTLGGTLPVGGSARFRYGTVAGGPYPSTTAAAPYAAGATSANVTGLTANTAYYYVLEVLDNTNTVVAISAQCTLTTLAVVVPPAPTACPLPDNVSKCLATPTYNIGGVDYIAMKYCDANGELLAVYQLCAGVPSGTPTFYTTLGAPYTPVGAIHDCSSGFDFEQFIFCDTGTAPSTPFISRVRWDENGDLLAEQTGTFTLDGVTPYTPVGAITICDSGTLPPQAFCFKSSATAPQTFPGRSFTGTLSIARGFKVASVVVGSTTYPLGIEWNVLDESATTFAPALAAGIQSKIPGSTVTVTPTGTIDQCLVTPQSFTINIACIKQSTAPVNIDLIYDGGTDLIQNAGFESVPPDTSFHQGKRQDNGGFIRCTNIANRGWETNDPNGEFEQWPAGFLGSTPTPRGTAIQEVNANGANTIWQTVSVPIAATYTMRATVGGRGATEQFPIKLSTGDTNAAGPGDLINAVITAPSITGGTGTPWTSFTQTVFLNPGIYTLSLKGPNTPSIGGIFTDLRLFTTDAGKVASLTPNSTCTVTENVTTQTTDCQIWQPLTGAGGAIVQWVNPKTNVTLSNAAFWAQVPAPSCCTSDPAGGTEITAPNLEDSYIVCGTVAGVQTPLIRQLIMDQNGGTISQNFITIDGVTVTPTTWTPGDCERGFEVEVLCDDNGSFLRRYVRDAEGNITSVNLLLDGSAIYLPVGAVKNCGGDTSTEAIVCAAGVTLIRRTSSANVVTFIGTNGATVATPATYTIGACRDDIETPVCFETTVAQQVVNDDWVGLTVLGKTATNNNFAGIGEKVSVTINPGPPAPFVLGQVVWGGTAQALQFDLGSLRTSVSLTFDNYGTTQGDLINNISPTPTSVTGAGTLVGNSITPTTANGQIVVNFAGPVQFISMDWTGTGGGATSQGNIAFTIPAYQDRSTWTRSVLTDGTIRYVDEAGVIQTALPAGAILRDCSQSGSAQIVAECSDVGRASVTFGANLLGNGDFQQSTGTGATSSNGPTWTTAYTPVNDIFAAGAGSYAFFTTNAGAVTGGNPLATPIQALTGRSMAVNVGPVLTTPIISWANIYLENGRTYSLQADVAIISNPYSVAIRIDGVVIAPLVAPVVTGAWQKTNTLFTWTGTSGYHTVSVNSNSAAGAGNDHTFDNFYLRAAYPTNGETLTPQSYDSTVRATIDQVVETAGCNDDRRDQILGEIAQSLTTSTAKDYESFDLCFQANTAAAGYAIGDIVRLNRWFDLTTGAPVQVAETAINTTQGGLTVAVPLTAANFDECPSGGASFTETIICAAGVQMIRRLSSTGTLTFISSNGVTVAAPAVYTIGQCASAESHIFNVAAGATWTPANIPAGKALVGLSMSVLGATAGITDADGTAVTLLPAGYSAGWDAAIGGTLIPPQNISAVAVTGRVIVTMLVK